ncbi:MAG: hypothetical protein O7B81_06045 [Gammaproteobacteria bacterium]|nr:hypothetical protein [Gammaproteobacteria bacterium]
MSRSMQWVLLWASASTVACLFALSWLPAAFDGDTYTPIGADSFYHARRILDTVADPHAFYEFDTAIHAPEGSLLTWPWAYDRMAAWIVAGAMKLGAAADPMAVLAYLPVATVPISVGLVIVLGLLSGLPRWAVVALASAYAVSPLTRELHAVGRIDHHFVEHFFFLASLCAGMAWLKAPTPARAVLFGAVLGVAPGFHNGLFVLQAFLGGAIVVLWLRGLLELRRTESWFAAALVISSLAILLPSEPFRAFEWAFYYLGWFHLLSAMLSAALVCWLAGRAPNRLNIYVLAAVSLTVGFLAWSQIGHGGRFVFANMPALSDVTESTSLIEILRAGRGAYLTERYTFMIWLLPAIAFGLVFTVLRSRAPDRILLTVTLLGGGFLLLQQLRLHYFGYLILMVPPLLWAATRKKTLAVATGAAFLAAQVPAALDFGTHPVFAGDRNYAVNRSLILALGKRCAIDPGVVLARFGDGHYLRFHTNCAVIANNMIMTRQHLERIALTETLFDLAPAVLRAAYPWIDYVYLWRQDQPLNRADSEADDLQASALARGLLMNSSMPEGFELIGETAFEWPDRERVVFARAFHISH